MLTPELQKAPHANQGMQVVEPRENNMNI